MKMVQNYSWKAQPIFISSTFTDMMAERDALRDFVFKELDERLNERRVRLEPIDLRWGVETTDEKEKEQKELQVLKVCLNEIDRCQPFFIGIIGDRYGWVPPQKRMQAAEEERGFKSELKDKSITALEIEYGVLASKAQLKRSYFFFREPLPYDKMPADVVIQYSDQYRSGVDKQFAERRLNDFKELIIQAVGKDRVLRYSTQWDNKRNKVIGLETFQNLVLDKLWQDLDEHTKELEDTRSKTWQDEERHNLDEFIEERSISFSAREDATHDLKTFVRSESGYDNWGVCITGESGSGKSALFAKLYKDLQNDNAIFLAHAAGISSRSNNLDTMLTLWIEELAGHLNLTMSEELKKKTKIEDLTKLFAELLSRNATNKRVVILIDALNRFERTAQAKYINWLPELLPANVKCIFTAIAGEETENLSKRKGIKIEELKPVCKTDAETIINTLCQRYHKTLNPKAIEVLLNKKKDDGSFAYSNPLWLTMAVDEFLLLDEDDFARMKNFKGDAEQKLEKLLLLSAEKMPADITGMYGYVFDRCKIFGEEFANGLLSYIGISRNGLRESDLEKLMTHNTNTKWDNLNFAAFRRYLRDHIVRKGDIGLWDFRHVQARESLMKYLFKNEDEVIKLHNRVAAYLEELNEEDPLRLTEIMWHVFQCDDKKKAAELYGSTWDDFKTGEFSNTLRDILIEKENNIEWFTSLFEITNIHERVKAVLIHNVLVALNDRIVDHLSLARRLRIFLKVGEVSAQLYKLNPYAISCARELSLSYEGLGHIYKALGDSKNALANYESSLAIDEEVRKQDPLSDQSASALSASYGNVGDIYDALGDEKSALSSYESSLKIAEELHKRNPDSAEDARNVSTIYNKVGDIYTYLRDMKSALSSYKRALEISEELHKRNPDSAEDAESVSISYVKVGDIYSAYGDSKSALSSYERSHDMFVELRKRNPDSAKCARDLAISMNKVGDINIALGDKKSALESYEGSHNIFVELYKRNPDSAELANDLTLSYYKVGDSYEAVGDTKRAISSYEGSLKIAEELRKLNPDSVEYARGLIISYYKLNRINDLKEVLKDMKRKNMLMDPHLSNLCIILGIE